MPRVEIPGKLRFLFKPKRYKVAFGGRGAAKSWSYARALLVKALESKIRILCARELQTSIRDSVHRLLCDQIDEVGYSEYFHTTERSITCVSGSEFIFSGLRSNIGQIKSKEGIDICWVEEGEAVSDKSWEVLIPTIRKKRIEKGKVVDAEIWVTFNPHRKTDPVYKRFVTNTPPNAVVKKVGWRDNKWIPQTLIDEKDYLYSVDPDAADHVWGGNTRERTGAEILAGKWILEPFDPRPWEDEWNGPYQGVDWGFAVSPSTLVRCWVTGDPRELNHELWIEHEAYGVGVDNDELPQLFDKVPGARKFVTRADSARPETISHLRRNGYPKMVAAKKWPGSVEDGITHLRGYKQIHIHPRCKHWHDEARLYSYKVDKLTGDVLPIIVDAHNHLIDPTRYALGPLIKVENRPTISVIK